MYHFKYESIAESLVLSEREQISGNICQYLKQFQIRAIRDIHAQFQKRQAFILNDEAGMGKCVTVAAFLGAVATDQKCLIITNTEELVVGWQFHLSLFTTLSVVIFNGDMDYTSSSNINIFKWRTLKDFENLKKIKYDFIVLDNRGGILNNSFCVGSLLKAYEKNINLLISTVDITSDLKLLHNVLRLCGRLNHRYLSWKAFRDEFSLPNIKEVSSNKSGLEEYFLKREILCDMCKDFRLRRYRHQYPNCLPLVDKSIYKNNLMAWKKDQAARTLKNSSAAMPLEEELFEPSINKSQEITFSDEVASILTSKSSNTRVDVSKNPILVSPPLFGTESENEVVLTNKEPNSKDPSLRDVHSGEEITTSPRTELPIVNNFSDLRCTTPSSVCEVRTLRNRTVKLTKSIEKCRKVRKAPTTKSTPNRSGSIKKNFEINEYNPDATSTNASNHSTENSVISPKVNTEKIDSLTSEDLFSPKSCISKISTATTEPETTNVRMESIEASKETEIGNQTPKSIEAPLVFNSQLEINLSNEILDIYVMNTPPKQQNMHVKSDPSGLNIFSANFPHEVATKDIEGVKPATFSSNEVLQKPESAQFFHTSDDTQEVASIVEEKTFDANNDANCSSNAPTLMISDYDQFECDETLSDFNTEYTKALFRNSYSLLIGETSLTRTSEQLSSHHIACSDLPIAYSPDPASNIIVGSEDDNLLSANSSERCYKPFSKRKDPLKHTKIDSSTVNSYNEFNSKVRKISNEQNCSTARKTAKSPDLFSNYSDTDVTCSPILKNSISEGFKELDPEIIEITHVAAFSNNSRQRSCLDIKKENLRSYEEPHGYAGVIDEALNNEKEEAKHPVFSYNEHSLKNSSHQLIKPACFGKTVEVNKHCTFGFMMRILRRGDVSPLQKHQLNTPHRAQHNKITNYFKSSPRQM